MVVFRNCIFYEKTGSSEKKNSKRDTFELRKLNMPLKITYGFMTQQLFLLQSMFLVQKCVINVN